MSTLKEDIEYCESHPTGFSKSELEIKRKYCNGGYVCLKGGAPDCVFFKLDGNIIRDILFVEIKSNECRLTPKQRLYKKILESLGLSYRIEKSDTEAYVNNLARIYNARVGTIRQILSRYPNGVSESELIYWIKIEHKQGIKFLSELEKKGIIRLVRATKGIRYQLEEIYKVIPSTQKLVEVFYEIYNQPPPQLLKATSIGSQTEKEISDPELMSINMIRKMVEIPYGEKACKLNTQKKKKPIDYSTINLPEGVTVEYLPEVSIHSR